MRPNASTAARTSRPVRKIRTRPPKRSPPPANSSIRKPGTMTWNPSRKRRPRSSPTSLLRPESAQARPIWPGLIFLPLQKAYFEIGGTGGPAGVTGAGVGSGGGAEAVTAAGAGCGADGGGAAAAGSGDPLETAADFAREAGGAGVTGGTGSARSTGVSPLPVSLGASILFGVSTLAASDFPSDLPSGFPSSSLAVSFTVSLAVSLLGLSSLAASLFAGSSVAASGFTASDFAASDLAASDLAASVLGGSSPPGLPRLLSLCLAVGLRAAGRTWLAP